MARFDLTDFEWSVIDAASALRSHVAVPRVDDRRVLNGILWRLRTGAPWADIPDRYGPHTTCVNRFNRWRKARRLGSSSRPVVSEAYDGDIQMIDSSSIRVHQHAANTKKKMLRSRCMGRSRGGLTTKIHALVDADGLPIALKLTEGQAHDGRSAEDMLGTARERRTILLADTRLRLRRATRHARQARRLFANIKPMAPIERPTRAFSRLPLSLREISSSASSTSSNTSALSRRATTSGPTTSSPQSNSRRCVSGFALNESMA